MKGVKNSARGEKTAVGGTWAQYEYSACIIYKLMQADTFEWITVLDPDAGILDDLLFKASDCVLGIQVKTEMVPKPVALHKRLIDGCLIREIARSWASLEAKHYGSLVKARYVFGGYFSRDDYALANKNSKGAKHSAAFVDFMNSCKLTPALVEKCAWSEALRKMRGLTGLGQEDFVRFLNSLELRDGQEISANRIAAFPEWEQQRLRQIQALLPTLVVECPLGSTVSESQLINRLGWQTKLSQRKIHEFPVPDDCQDNDTSRLQLLTAISECSSGYIGLIGAPGTGKSTLLQRGIQASPQFGVVRYLAFVPDQRHGLGRAEAGDFLNDLTAGMKQLGFHSSSFRSEMLGELRRELSRQLTDAGQRFTETGRKTVIVVDGLDHIPREETPISSFLKELPAPQALPNGVLVVLGSQHLDIADLKPSIVQQAKSEERCIHISPLSRAAIFGMAQAANLPEYVDRACLYDATAGHPLTARYFIEALKAAKNSADAEQVLSYSNGLGRGLAEIYERVWKALAADGQAKHALALLSRADGEISAHALAMQVGEPAVVEMLLRARFLLALKDGVYLSIFHNSFRLYVAAETGKRFGLADEQKEKDLYKELAAIAERSSEDDPQFWMSLRYRARSGDDGAVLQLGSPHYFRRMLAAFRPNTDISIDLHLTYAAVKSTRDRVLLLNKLLIEKEIEYRLAAFEETDFVELFLSLGDLDNANRHALNRGFGTGWLSLVDKLWHEGDKSRARQIFEANEPLEALFGQERTDAYHHVEEIRDWVRRAHRFRPLDRVAEVIVAIPFGERVGGWNDEGEIKQELLFCLAQGVVYDNPDAQPEFAVNLPEEDRQYLEISRAKYLLRDGRRDKSIEALHKAAAIAALDQISLPWRRLAASVAYKAGAIGDARSFLDLTETVSVANVDGPVGAETFEAICHERYGLAFLSEALSIELTKIKPTKQGILSSLEGHIDELAKLRANAIAGIPIAATEIRSLVNFLAQARQQQSYSNEHYFFSAVGWFCEELLKVSHLAGQVVFQSTVSMLDARLAASGNNLFNSEDAHLRAARAIYDIDGDRNAAKRRIESAIIIFQGSRTPQEAIGTAVACAKAFAYVGLVSEAWRCLQSSHQDAFGYWLAAKKEPQYEFWEWAFLGACKSAPSRAGEYGRVFGRFLLGLGQTEGDDTAARVIPTLLLGAKDAPDVQAALIEHLIDSNLITWAGLAGSVLKGIILSTPELAIPCVTAFCRLVVPFCDGNDREFIQASSEVVGKQDHISVGEMFVSSISRWCSIAGRSSLFKQLNCLLPSERVEPFLSDATKQSQDLHAMAHGSGQENSNKNRRVAAETLEELLAHGDGKSSYGEDVDYEYASAAHKLAPKLTKMEIERLLEERPLLKSSVKFMVECSRAMLRAGDRDFSDQLFRDAESAVGTGSWASFYGGQKLAIQQLRVERDGDQGRERGFEILVDELASGQTSGTSLFLNLGEVLEQVCVDMPFEEIWGETENHLTHYREYRLGESVEAIETVESQDALLGFIISKAFGFSCPNLLDHARASAHAVAAQPSGQDVLLSLLGFLEKQADGRREAIALLYRLRKYKHLSEVLVDVASRYIHAGDFVVFHQAQRILKEAGLPDDSEGTPQDLPAYYRIELSESPQSTDFELPPGISDGSRSVWSDDPWTWTAGWRFVFDFMSRASGIKVEVLRRRCAEFMRREGGKEAFGPEVDDRILSRLSSLKLCFPYRRPLPAAASRGIGEVLGELARAHHVDPRVFALLWPEIGGPSMGDFAPPVDVRPIWVELPAFPVGVRKGLDDDALENQLLGRLAVPVSPNEFVLVERSFFRFHVWREKFEHTRTCLISSPEGSVLGYDPFKDIPALVSIEDFRPPYEPEQSAIVAKVPSNCFGDLRRSILTLCPYVLEELGWHRSSINPFEILDEHGTRMARTLVWVDGVDYSSSWDEDLFGDGQVLLLTPTAHDKLSELIGNFNVGVWAELKHLDQNGKSSVGQMSAL